MYTGSVQPLELKGRRFEMLSSIHQWLEGVSYQCQKQGETLPAVTGVASDSRKVKRGDLFVAVPGSTLDGRRFIPDAISRGASAVVSEPLGDSNHSIGVPCLIVPNARKAIAQIAANAFGRPADRLKSIGVTGTNGKTTISFLIQFLVGLKHPTGIVGTVHYDDGKKKCAAHQTTPGPLELHERLSRMRTNGLTHVVMEISSHALDQDRTFGITFSEAVFTNLTQDHLDYHHDFEHYFAAKKKLFLEEPRPRRAVVNIDDPFGVSLVRELKRDQVITFGIREPADVCAKSLTVSLTSVEFDLVTDGMEYRVKAPLGLSLNVYNLLAALAVARSEGVSLKDAIGALENFKGVCGRMERIEEGQDFQFFIDYAHTPDALRNVLSETGKRSRSRIISVFGCGGDRDRGKRALMGAVAAQYSDLVIVTSDNSRSEDPESIFKDIRQGIDSKHAVLQIADREEAIRHAIQTAQAGDIVFLFGKGHERYQIVGNQSYPFSDHEVARKYLRKKCLPSSKLRTFAAGN